ncbi:hypothetical protein PJI16_17495 [Nitrospira sp. MA-1]|nr:hypothetical protein [Nitrospira sp. MA-1]
MFEFSGLNQTEGEEKGGGVDEGESEGKIGEQIDLIGILLM